MPPPFNSSFDPCAITTPACRNDCEVCIHQYHTDEDLKIGGFLWYRSHLSVEEASIKCQSMLRKIDVIRKVLQSRLAEHGDTIFTRWEKMAEIKRCQVLREVQPLLLTDLIWQKLHEGRRFMPYSHDTEEYRAAVLMPSVNRDELIANHTRFLGLLHSRASLPPEAFVRFDHHELKVLWYQGYITEDFVDGSFVMTGEDFGKWTDWKAAEVHSMYTFGGPHALTILELQERTLIFLYRLVNRILTKSLPKRSGDKQLQALIQTGLRTPAEQVVDLQISAQYLPPPIFNPQEVLEVTKSWATAARNELLLLQNYPDYFYKHLKNCQLRLSRNLVPVGQQPRQLVLDALLWPTMYTILWELLTSKADLVLKLYQLHKDDIHHGRPLPPSYEQALQALDAVGVLVKESCSMRIRKDFPQFCSQSRDDQSKGSDKLFQKDRVARASSLLASGSGSTKKTLSKLDLFPKDNPDPEQPMDPTLQNLLMAVRDCRRIWEIGQYHAPLYRRELTKAEKAEVIGNEESTWLQYCNKMMNGGKLYFEIDPRLNEQSCFAPVGGRKDIEGLQKDEARRTLVEDIWATFLEKHVTLHYSVVEGLGYSVSRESTLGKVLSRLHQKAPVSDLAKQRESILARYHEQLRTSNTKQSGPVISDWAHPHLEYNDEVFRAVVPKIKQKTRKVPTVSEDTEELQPDNHAEGMPQKAASVYKLPRKLFFVIQQIFPEEGERFGSTVQWQDFLNMMADVGFAIETNGGSAFGFILEERGRIVIHRPHPDSTLQSFHLRNIGTALENQFGWQRMNFECA